MFWVKKYRSIFTRTDVFDKDHNTNNGGISAIIWIATTTTITITTCLELNFACFDCCLGNEMFHCMNTEEGGYQLTSWEQKIEKVQQLK